MPRRGRSARSRPAVGRVQLKHERSDVTWVVFTAVGLTFKGEPGDGQSSCHAGPFAQAMYPRKHRPRVGMGGPEWIFATAGAALAKELAPVVITPAGRRPGPGLILGSH